MLDHNEILLNQRFENAQPNIDSKLTLTYEYYVYQQDSLGGGITTEFNVRQFLSDNTNDEIGDDFFSFLNANTSIEEFRNIYNSNEKLSSIFNVYYEKSVINSQASTRSFVTPELTGTSQISIFTPNTFNWSDSSSIDLYGNKMDGEVDSLTSGERNIYGPNGKAVLVNISTEESYYLPLFLTQSHTQTATMNFASISKDCYRDVEGDDGEVKTVFLKQCFVENGFKGFDEINELYNNPTLGQAAFTQPTFNIDEGEGATVVISLEEPSRFGLEEITIFIDEEETTAATTDYFIFIDGSPSPEKSFDFKFEVGEQTKTVSVFARADEVNDDDNKVCLKIKSPRNVNIGLGKTEINITDTTEVKTIQLAPTTIATVGETILTDSTFIGRAKVKVGTSTYQNRLSIGIENFKVDFNNNSTVAIASGLRGKPWEDSASEYDITNGVYTPNRDKKISIRATYYFSKKDIPFNSDEILLAKITANKGGATRLLGFVGGDGIVGNEQTAVQYAQKSGVISIEGVDVFEGESITVSFQSFFKRTDSTEEFLNSSNVNTKGLASISGFEFEVYDVVNEAFRPLDIQVLQLSEGSSVNIETLLNKSSGSGIESVSIQSKFNTFTVKIGNYTPSTGVVYYDIEVEDGVDSFISRDITNAFSISPSRLDWNVGDTVKTSVLTLGSLGGASQYKDQIVGEIFISDPSNATLGENIKYYYEIV